MMGLVVGVPGDVEVLAHVMCVESTTPPAVEEPVDGGGRVAHEVQQADACVGDIARNQGSR